MIMTDTDPLKIGITCYPSVGGSGILASALGVELAKRGHEVHFISYERPFRLPSEAPRIFFHPVEINDYELFKYPDYTLPLSVKMADVSRAQRLDVLHVHYAVPHATAAILARDMVAEGRRPKVIATLHGTDTTLLGRDPGYAPAIRHALEHADAVTAVSHYLKGETERVIGVKRKIDVIHNFFEPRPASRTREKVRAELGLKDEVMVLHLSNLRPVKRVDLLLETVAKIRPRESFKLVILAGGDFAPYEGQVKSLGLEDRVIVRNNVFEVEDYLQASDLGLFTSESESFGLGILEAMAFSTPSVSTAVGGVPEVIASGVDGILCPMGDVEALVRASELLINDRKQRQQMGSEALAKARHVFSPDAIVPQYVELYRRVLDGCESSQS